MWSIIVATPRAMSKSMTRTIIVDAELRPSRAVVVVLAVVHLGAAACPWLAGLPTWASMAIGSMVIGWGARQISSIGCQRDPDAVVRFQLAGDGRVVLHRRGTESAEVAFEGIELLGPWGCVLAFRPPGCRVSRLLVWRDQCDARTMRRLRIAARWRIGIPVEAKAGSSFGDSRDLV